MVGERFAHLLLDFSNDLVVGDEVEVNNTTEHLCIPSGLHEKRDLFISRDTFPNTTPSDASSETFRLSPDPGSNCSTPSNSSETFDISPDLNQSSVKRIKRSISSSSTAGEPIIKMENYSSPMMNSEPGNRVHCVVQKGPTLVLQTDKSSRLSSFSNPLPRIKALSGGWSIAIFFSFAFFN